MATHTLESADGAVTLDLGLGSIAALRLANGIAPLHRAPWADEAEVEMGDEPPCVRRLSGDFFCAPFGTSDVEAAPLHGWTANSPWEPLGETREGPVHRARYRLARTVCGASVTKELTLRDGEPFLYQRHVLEGATVPLPVAHHPMVRMAAGGVLRFSRKRRVEAPAGWREALTALSYPFASDDPAGMAAADGGGCDIRLLPLAGRNEDFVMMAEAAGAGLGWTAVSRHAEGDVVLVLKDTGVLPLTMLWFSNGGRDRPPWNGRHTGVLGIEDGCCLGPDGHAAALRPNRLTAEGVPTALPGERIEVRHVIGALAGTGPVAAVAARPGALEVAFADGGGAALPYDNGFLGWRHTVVRQCDLLQVTEFTGEIR